MVCKHLRSLEKALQTAGYRETSRGQAWTDNAREWVYFDCFLDRGLLGSFLSSASNVVYHEHLGTHSGNEAGFVCTMCNDAVMGHHPQMRNSISAPDFPPKRIQTKVTRDSVAAGDDILSPHARAIAFPNTALVGDFIDTIANTYLPLGHDLSWALIFREKQIATITGRTPTVIYALPADTHITEMITGGELFQVHCRLTWAAFP